MGNDDLQEFFWRFIIAQGVHVHRLRSSVDDRG